MNHVMIDIETLGRTPRAAILSIGAVGMDDAFTEFADFYIAVDPAQSHGGEYDIDAETVAWWAQQSDEARAVFTDPERVHIAQALSAMESWLQHVPRPRKVWAKPPRFDVAILEHAYRAEIRRPWWDHRDVLDLRTLIYLRDPDGLLRPLVDGVKHNALSDARQQARYLARLMGMSHG